jgi:type I restriction enzyme S subunit
MRDGWTETSLGTVLKLSNEKLGAHKEEPEIFAISKYDGVVLAQDYFDRRIASKSLDGYKVIGPGDWVYSTIHIDEGSIAVNHFPFRGVVSPMYTSMIWNSHLHDCRFFELLLKSDGALIRYQENAQGTVNRRRSLSWKAFSEMTFVVPPHTEQKRIVDVVFSVDAYIDALQQQAVSARTARNAVLHELLSAGGDGWTETTIGKEALINPKESALALDAPFVPMDAVKVGKRFVDYFEPRGERSGARAKSGDVLFARITPCLENGKVAQIQDGVGVCGGSTEFIVLRGTETINSDFIYFWATLGSTRDLAAGLMTGTTGRQRLSANDLSEIVLNLPPLAEQKRIVEIVSSMDDVIQSTEQAVTDAKNLRSGLLSDLLSGEHEIPASYDSLLGAA